MHLLCEQGVVYETHEVDLSLEGEKNGNGENKKEKKVKVSKTAFFKVVGVQEDDTPGRWARLGRPAHNTQTTAAGATKLLTMVRL